jgi:hypothetical protein
MFAYFVEDAKKWEAKAKKEVEAEEKALQRPIDVAAPIAAAAPYSQIASMSSLFSSMPPQLEAMPEMEELKKILKEVSIQDVLEFMSLLGTVIECLGVDPKASLFDVFMAFDSGEFSRYKLVSAVAKAKHEIGYSGGSQLVDRLLSMIQAGSQPEEQTEAGSEEPAEVVSEEKKGILQNEKEVA